MSHNVSKSLVLRLSANEAESLEQAAQAAGIPPDDVATWAKKMLVEYAESLAPNSEPRTENGVEILPAPPPPQCFCGETRDPKGQCDSSCIMRY